MEGVPAIEEFLLLNGETSKITTASTIGATREARLKTYGTSSVVRRRRKWRELARVRLRSTEENTSVREIRDAGRRGEQDRDDAQGQAEEDSHAQPDDEEDSGAPGEAGKSDEH